MSGSRNDPCPCGSGKKYKKCCQTQDQKAAAEARRERLDAEETVRHQRRAEEETFQARVEELETLSNRANDQIVAGKWDEAEASCRDLLERFPEQIDGHQRFCELYKARGELARAADHARQALALAEADGGFDPEFCADLREDIAHAEAQDQES